MMEAVLLHNLGLVHGKLDMFDEALINYKRSLTLKRQLFGEEHPECASTLNCLGAVWGTKGEKEKALSYFREALRLLEKGVGEGANKDNDETATNPNIVNAKRYIGLIEGSKR